MPLSSSRKAPSIWWKHIITLCSGQHIYLPLYRTSWSSTPKYTISEQNRAVVAGQQARLPAATSRYRILNVLWPFVSSVAVGGTHIHKCWRARPTMPITCLNPYYAIICDTDVEETRYKQMSLEAIDIPLPLVPHNRLPQ